MKRWQLCRTCVLIGVSWIVFFPMSAAGQLLVADFGTSQISEYNLDGTYSKVLLSSPSSPSAMAIGSGTDLFVASQNTGTVYRYNWLTGGSSGTFDTGLAGVGGLLYDNTSNTLYASEFNSYTGHRIIKCNATTGAQIGVLDVVTSMDLADMALGADGSLYVSSFWDGTVYKYNSTAGTFTALSSPAGSLSGANGLALDSSGNLDVVGMLTNNVFQFNSGGAAAGNLISGSSGGLSFPSDIVIDPNGNLLISSMGDWGQNGYISKYNSITKEINSGFITSQVKPTGLIIEPAVWTGGAAEIEHDMQLGPGGGPFDTGDKKLVITGVLGETGGSQSLTKTGSGELVLKASNTYTGATNIDQGTLTIDGGDLADASRVDVACGATLQVISGTPGLGDIAGSGSTIVSGAGTVLSVNSITQNTLTIGSGATLIINPIPGGPLCLQSMQAVPEPGTMTLLATAGLLASLVFLPRRRKT
jgi:fibronectin-binding autotransporter adhesin